MKTLLMGLLILGAPPVFAEDASNCKLIGKPKSHGSVIVMPWVRVTRISTVNTLQECVEAGQNFLSEVSDEYDGRIYLGKSSYRLVKFEFKTKDHRIEGKIRNP